MKFIPTNVEGAFLVEPEKRQDARGTFARIWCQKEWTQQGININGFVQFNVSQTLKAGTIRGLHYQAEPHKEAKLVRCVKGKIYDVIVDLRLQSPTFTKWAGIELCEDNLKALYLPEGVAHGFQTLMENTEIFYASSAFYYPESERGIRWDDPLFKITWPLNTNPIVSDKDRQWPDFSMGG